MFPVAWTGLIQSFFNIRKAPLIITAPPVPFYLKVNSAALNGRQRSRNPLLKIATDPMATSLSRRSPERDGNSVSLFCDFLSADGSVVVFILLVDG